MSRAPASDSKWNEGSSASTGLLADIDSMFQLLFERSADAIVLFDPQTNVFVDCNDAAVALMRAGSKAKLLQISPADLAPPFQPDGRSSREKAAEITGLVQKNGSHRFEWVARRFDGTDVPLENLATAIPVRGRLLHVIVPRDIGERKRAEAEVRELNATLERRIVERTAELAASEARLRTLVENAPEAIVVFDGRTGRFRFGNAHACHLYGYCADELTKLTPAEVSPEFQADGRRSIDVAHEKMNEALAGGTPVFEWIHRHLSGRLIPTEVRLVRLPAEGQQWLRASIIDNTERKRREAIQQATFQISEAVHTADDLPSFYARIHAIVQTLMPAKNFYIALYDAATEIISFPYFVDESETVPKPFKLGKGLTSYVLRTGRPLVLGAEMNARKRRVGDEVTFEGLSDLHYVESGTPAAIWVGVPLSLGGQPLGVMAVQDYRDVDAYGEVEKQILTFVAEQTALALERKRAQQALRESERKFRALFEATSTGVMIHDEHQYLEVNPAMVRMFGCSSAADLVGKNPVVTSPPLQPGGMPTAELARRHIVECVEHGTARFDWLARRADGTDFPVEVILTRIEMAGRHLMQAVVNDISERKRVEAELRASAERLRESEARFSAAFHASPVLSAIARMDDGRFVEANEAFVAWSGYRRDDVLGRTSAELNLWVDSAARAAFWEELRTRGRVRHSECEMRNRRGAVHTALISADVIEINKQPHVLTVGLDITERKRAELGMWRALEQERELSQLKSNFVSMVSHEFRTPLGIILSSAQILSDYLDQLPEAERREHLEAIAKNSKRMAGLMEEVLVLSRVESGKLAYEPAPLDLPVFCRRLVEEVRSATGGACPIAFIVGPDCAVARADERLLRHIFTNVLTNAVKYSTPGTPVEFRLEHESRHAVCRVRDRGIGIPEADLRRLFSAFHRGRNVGQVPGSGLGLVIVKRCVELHGGTIQVESQAGEGTTVTVRLPVF